MQRKFISYHICLQTGLARVKQCANGHDHRNERVRLAAPKYAVHEHDRGAPGLGVRVEAAEPPNSISHDLFLALVELELLQLIGEDLIAHARGELEVQGRDRWKFGQVNLTIRQ